MTEAGSRARATHLPHIESGGAAAIDATTTQRSVDDLMRAARWAEAAALLERGGGRDLPTILKLRLARNLAAMQVHLPTLYRVLTQSPHTGRYQLMAARDGKLTIALVQPGKAPCFLSDQALPSQGLARLSALARDPANQYHVMALLGMGDGYFVSWLAQNPLPDSLGMVMPVYVIEPEPEIIYQAMMIHDWTGPTGPIFQRRFIWSVGADWEAAFQQSLRDEVQLRHPSMQITQSILGDQIATRLDAVLELDKAAQVSSRHRLQSYYEGHTASRIRALLGNNPPRQPRMLCMTSRFSTVVQYSVRDMARALDRLGWQTRVLTDNAPHLAVGIAALLRTMDEFKPDVVLTINHVRGESGLADAFPPNLPYVCWIQDHTRGLMDPAVGAAISPRDFVLVESPQQYVDRFGYPASQCLAMPKLTAVLPLPVVKEPEGENLVYVSHASGRPDQLYEELCVPSEGRSAQHHDLLVQCGRRLLDLYAAGGCCPTTDLMHELIRNVARDSSLPAPSDMDREVLCQALYLPLNNALYRQQTLGWIVNVADRLGLRLGIYGGGWENHPRFTRFARGKVAFGPELQALTRRSRINFQIVPYAFFHQRLFEGLMAGGFFLIRRNPHDPIQAERFRLQGLIQGNLPDLDQVCFEDQEGLVGLIQRFIAAPELRQQIMAKQRLFVAEHFTYDKGAGRLLEMMRQRITAEPTESLEGWPLPAQAQVTGGKNGHGTPS